jgi:hypothetical protein
MAPAAGDGQYTARSPSCRRVGIEPHMRFERVSAACGGGVGCGTVLTVLTVLTGLTADVVDFVEVIDLCRQ